ncbi:D-threo-aldose 1-dehydrogenase [Enhydrobacter aerosaccus]|uniref:D-threo-aldose 1-dehydrogenase n=1 Tax=Enhydrobacter aerosaccus TaxID=225324 RepID=A0A1T4THE3_9HYPH|nr:aldo/keto reductase [Enhydrobacter aerosaccus]SKA39886.1 D-threo-aldose 1-dehydrogenase [Enhydrobacter aerosaccus]
MTLPKRRVGRTKLEVTTLGLGGAPMGGFRATISNAKATALTNAAYDGGVRYFDTSPFYGYGRSELRMGAALREKPRDAFVLSTKIGRVMHVMRPGEPKPADFREHGLPGFAPVFDYTYDGVMRSLEHSHLRLGLAKIDIALVHDVDFWTIQDRDILDQRFKTVMDSGFRALDELRKAGIISAIGVGINEADTSLRFIQAGDFDCMLLAGRYTLLEQGALEAFLPECVTRGVSVILGGPYNSGILASGVTETATHDYVQAPAPLIDKARKIEAICGRHGVELGAAALQFPLHHPALCSVIPGALGVDEVKQNVARLSATIPAELWSELKHERLLDPAAPTPN